MSTHFIIGNVEKDNSKREYVLKLRYPCYEPISITMDDAILLRQIRRLLQRIVDENRTVLMRETKSRKHQELIDLAWICAREGTVGQWRVGSVEGWFSEWDVALIKRYIEFLAKVRGLIGEEVCNEDG